MFFFPYRPFPDSAYFLLPHSILSPDTYNVFNTDYSTTIPTYARTLQLKNFMHLFNLLNLCSTPKSSVTIDLTFIYLWVMNLGTQNMAVRILKFYKLGKTCIHIFPAHLPDLNKLYHTMHSLTLLNTLYTLIHDTDHLY